MQFEYIVVPAPKKVKSARGVKGGPAKVAHAMTQLMNEMAESGWEYQRADTLPMEERQGLTKKTVNYHSLLVFRRAVQAEQWQEPVVAAPPVQQPAAEDYDERYAQARQDEQSQYYDDEPLEEYADERRDDRGVAAQ